MKSNPDFFRLPEVEQEKIRVTFFHNEDNDPIFDEIIGKEFFGKPLVEEHFEEFSAKDYATYNKQRAILCGYGKNKVHVDEFFSVENPIFKFETYNDYAQAEGEAAHKYMLEDAEERKDHASLDMLKNHSGEYPLGSVWFQMIDNEKLYYCSLIPVIDWATEILLFYISESAGKIYKHDLRELEPNETVSGNLSQLGLTIDAGGKEEQLKELERRTREYLSSIKAELEMESNKACHGVIIYNEPENGQDCLKILVPSTKVASSLRWLTIADDIALLSVSSVSFDELIDKYKAKIDAYTQEQYLDIENNFEPGKVVPIKEMQIIFADAFIDDIESIHRVEQCSKEDGEDD